MLKIGHRGCSSEPENTLAAFRKGLKLGANAIEFDVRATKDKKVVVFHDADVTRLTSGKGKVKDYALKDLRKLDVNGEKIPTLQEAVKLLKGKCLIVIEIKEKGIEEVVVKAVKGIKNVIVISFSTETVRKVKELNPKLQVGLIFSNKIKNVAGFFRLNKAIKSDWLFGKSSTWNRKFVADAHRWKFKTAVWVANSTKSIGKFKSYGLDAIASDKPELFKGL